jgi:hypothetical protein
MEIVSEEHILTGYNPISLMGMMDTYPSTKEAMQETRVKDAVLKSFSDFVRLGSANKCMSTKKNAGPELAGCILEYPKVIVEPHYTQDVKAMAEAFKEVSAVRLPFPKMTIISGEMADIDFNDDSEIRQAKNNEDQNGSVNMLYCYFLSEVTDGIEIKVLLGKPNQRDNIYIDTAKIIHDGDELRFSLSNKVYDPNSKLIIEKEKYMPSYLHSAIVAIYMMTMGKNNFYMSVPTLEEAATNRKRISKGKKPLIEFKMAVIEGKKTAMSSTPHGTHASPRLHWRRGHWRTMTKSGKKTWIAPMEVGDEDNGRVIKTYAIGKYSLMENADGRTNRI